MYSRQGTAGGRDQREIEARSSGHEGRGYPCVQGDRGVRADIGEAGGRHTDTLQCGTTGHMQIRHCDGTDLSGTGEGVSFPRVCG